MNRVPVAIQDQEYSVHIAEVTHIPMSHFDKILCGLASALLDGAIPLAEHAWQFTLDDPAEHPLVCRACIAVEKYRSRAEAGW